MGYRTLAAAASDLDRAGRLVRIEQEIDPHLEAAEIHRRVCAASGPAGVLALAGLAGLPPLGVFPGVVLVVLVVSSHAPWVLVPLLAALVPMLLAGLPPRLRLWPLRPALLGSTSTWPVSFLNSAAAGSSG